MPKKLYVIMYDGKMLDFSRFVHWKTRTPIYLNGGGARRVINDLARRFPEFDPMKAAVVAYVPEQ